MTRRVSPEDVGDLLISPPRASLAFVADATIQALPVSFRSHDGRYMFGVMEASDSLVPGAPVQLLIDDGDYMSELRGIAIAGRIGERREGLSDSSITWFELLASLITAWDYSAMRRKQP